MCSLGLLWGFLDNCFNPLEHLPLQNGYNTTHFMEKWVSKAAESVDFAAREYCL